MHLNKYVFLGLMVLSNSSVASEVNGSILDNFKDLYDQRELEAFFSDPKFQNVLNPISPYTQDPNIEPLSDSSEITMPPPLFAESFTINFTPEMFTNVPPDRLSTISASSALLRRPIPQHPLSVAGVSNSASKQSNAEVTGKRREIGLTDPAGDNPVLFESVPALYSLSNGSNDSPNVVPSKKPKKYIDVNPRNAGSNYSSNVSSNKASIDKIVSKHEHLWVLNSFGDDERTVSVGEMKQMHGCPHNLKDFIARQKAKGWIQAVVVVQRSKSSGISGIYKITEMGMSAKAALERRIRDE